MENSLVIWDLQKLPKGISQDVILWQNYTNRENFLSIPSYLENNADRLKTKYLKFIHEFGENKFKGKRIIDHLDLGDGFSIWWMTLLAEKSPFKSPAIYDCLRLLAFEEIITAKVFSEVKLFSEDNNLALALQKLCKKFQIKFLWENANLKKRKKWSIKKIYYALPHELQAIIFLFRHVVTNWRLKKLDKLKWYSGSSVFFFALISFIWITITVERDYFFQDSGKYSLN